MTPSATARATAPRIAGPVAVAVALGAASVYTYVRTPFEAGTFPLCFFYAGTGLYCPGCGGLRAVHQLLHGDVVGALSLNPLAILVIIPMALVAFVWWSGSALGRDWHPPRIHPALYWALGAIVVAFSVLRNVGPLASYLAP